MKTHFTKPYIRHVGLGMICTTTRRFRSDGSRHEHVTMECPPIPTAEPVIELEPTHQDYEVLARRASYAMGC